jgi:hypothetical protein
VLEGHGVMGRLIRPVARPVFVALFAVGLVAGLPAAAAARMPETHRASVWQRQCEHAGGFLSDQAALVCEHLGEPQWDTRSVDRLSHFCTSALGGQPVYRSEFPVELVGCFF